MPEFTCRIAGTNGEVFERAYVAEDEAGLRRDLESQDLMILDLRRQNPLMGDLAKTLRIRGRVSMREFLLFNQEFAALIRAGLPIVEILNILLDRRKNQTFKVALMDIRDRVKSGESLSDSFSAQGDLFPPLYCSSLASGERSGELPSVLKRYIAFALSSLTLRSKVIQAMIYPMILGVVGFVILALMLFFIIPQFEAFLLDFGQELPLVTKLVLGVARFCQDYWVGIATAAGLTFAGWMAWNRTQSGRIAIERFKMRMPIFGKVIRDYAQNRFTRTLETLVAGGIPLVDAIELSARAVGSPVYETELMAVSTNVREGRPLWESLDETGLMDDIAVQMIKVGESTGSLEDMLNNCSEFTDREIEDRLAKIISMLEPAMLIAMAILVGIMMVAIYLPMLEMQGGGTSGGM